MKYGTMAAVLGIGAVLMTACRKEEPSPTALAAQQPGQAKTVGGKAYALVRSGAGYGIALTDPVTRSMEYLGDIVYSNGSRFADPCTGIAWDPVQQCTWLNTRMNSGSSSVLWRIDGPLPTAPGGSFVLSGEVKLSEPATGSAVANGMDIEWHNGTLYMLRNDLAGLDRKIATIDLSTALVHDLPGTPPDVQSLTIDQRGRMMALRCKASQLPPRMFQLDPATGDMIAWWNFSTSAFFAEDVGIAAYPNSVSAASLFGVNDLAPDPGLATSLDPTPYPNGVLYPTIDMTMAN